MLFPQNDLQSIKNMKQPIHVVCTACIWPDVFKQNKTRRKNVPFTHFHNNYPNGQVNIADPMKTMYDIYKDVMLKDTHQGKQLSIRNTSQSKRHRM